MWRVSHQGTLEVCWGKWSYCQWWNINGVSWKENSDGSIWERSNHLPLATMNPQHYGQPLSFTAINTNIETTSDRNRDLSPKPLLNCEVSPRIKLFLNRHALISLWQRCNLFSRIGLIPCPDPSKHFPSYDAPATEPATLSQEDEMKPPDPKKRKRGEKGVDTPEVTEVSATPSFPTIPRNRLMIQRRRAQNRESQRTFSRRKEEREKQLQEQIDVLETQHNNLVKSYVSLEQNCQLAKKELDALTRLRHENEMASSMSELGGEIEMSENGVARQEEGMDRDLTEILFA